MLTDERLIELNRLPTDEYATKRELRNAIDELLYNYRILQQQKWMLVEALEWMIREPDGSNATTHAKNLLQAIQALQDKT